MNCVSSDQFKSFFAKTAADAVRLVPQSRHFDREQINGKATSFISFTSAGGHLFGHERPSKIAENARQNFCNHN